LQGSPEASALPGLGTTSVRCGCGFELKLAAVIGNENGIKPLALDICDYGADGELDEGNVWEAAMLAAKYRLNNIIAIVDRNNIQLDGLTEEVMPLEDLPAKWASFRLARHRDRRQQHGRIIKRLRHGPLDCREAVVLIAHTVPGKGVDFMEYDFHWHGNVPSDEQAKLALKSSEH